MDVKTEAKSDAKILDKIELVKGYIGGDPKLIAGRVLRIPEDVSAPVAQDWCRRGLAKVPGSVAPETEPPTELLADATRRLASMSVTTTAPRLGAPRKTGAANK